MKNKTKTINNFNSALIVFFFIFLQNILTRLIGGMDYKLNGLNILTTAIISLLMFVLFEINNKENKKQIPLLTKKELTQLKKDLRKETKRLKGKKK